MEEKERELREAEEEARRLAEEEALAREVAAKEKMLQEQTQDAFAVISDLDNALKAFQGALGLSDVSTYLEICYVTRRMQELKGQSLMDLQYNKPDSLVWGSFPNYTWLGCYSC